MSYSFNLEKLIRYLKNEKIISQNLINNIFKEQYYNLLLNISKKYSLDFEKTASMLYFPRYEIKLDISFILFKYKNKYNLKKPNIFLRLFVNYTKHTCRIYDDGKVSIDNNFIDDNEIKQILILQ